MYKEYVLIFLAIAIIILPPAVAKGGRGGGGRGGRSGSRSSSGRRGSSSSFSSSHSGHHTSGGLFHGFFHTPYHYTYSPTHITRSGSSSYHAPKEETSSVKKDTDNYAVGYAVSRSLSSDFFSIFNMVNDISNIPEKIKNKELLPSTTTQGPVTTYNLNEIISNPYEISNSNYDNVPKSFFLEDKSLYGMAATEKYEDDNKDIPPNTEDIFSRFLKNGYRSVYDEILYGRTATEKNLDYSKDFLRKAEDVFSDIFKNEYRSVELESNTKDVLLDISTEPSDEV